MEADGVALAFPLVAAPEFEEFDDPLLHLFFGVVWMMKHREIEGGLRAFFVADGGALDGVENAVRHEVAFVGLLVCLGTEFGGGLLLVDKTERRVGASFREAGGFHPAEPGAEVVLIDAGDGADTAGGVAIHGGVSDGCFRAVAGGEEEAVAEVGEHPDAGGADAGLNVLAGEVVFFPVELAFEDGLDGAFVALDELVDFPLGIVAVEHFSDGLGSLAGDVPAILCALVGAEEELLHPGGWVLGEVEIGQALTDCFDTELGGGEVEHDLGEAGDGGGIGASAEGDDEAI